MNRASCLLLVLVSCAPPIVRPAPFRQRPDSVAGGDLQGPFDGRVLDADTQRPVAGALVQGTWIFVEGYGLNAPAGWKEATATTDSNGHYSIPRLQSLPSGAVRLADFQLVVYKKGYVAYRSDRRFDDFGTRTDFTQRNQVVELDHWRSDLSHVKHLRYVGGGPTLAALTSWELSEAAAELSGKKPTGVVGLDATVGPTLGGAPLRAARLLTPEDVKRITGYQGAFDAGELGDEPPSEEYDSLHLRARNQAESFDVALRVWVMDIADAQKQYGRLIGDLPNVTERNEIGDRSIRATSDKNDIFGISWLDGRRGVVVLMTCGANQCRSHEVLITLARLVKERIDALGVVP